MISVSIKLRKKTDASKEENKKILIHQNDDEYSSFELYAVNVS